MILATVYDNNNNYYYKKDKTNRNRLVDYLRRWFPAQ